MRLLKKIPLFLYYITILSTDYIYIYIYIYISPALPVTALLDFNRARIWHKSQEKAYLRYRYIDHTTIQTSKCGAFTSEPKTVTIRLPPKNVLCNYYMCNIKVFNMEFRSAGHAYQRRFMKYIRMDEHALRLQLKQTKLRHAFLDIYIETGIK